MKKKTIVCILLLTVLAFICSCENGSGTGGTDEPPRAESNLVIPSGKEMTIIWNSSDGDAAVESYALEIYGSVCDMMDTVPNIFSDSEEKSGSEIVIGNSQREITRNAQLLLEEKIRNESTLMGKDDVVGCAVYAEGDSVAIIWTDYRIQHIALDYFMELITEEGINLEDGDFNAEALSLSAYLDERAEKIMDEAWALLAENLPEEQREEIIGELKELYSLYSSDMIVWLANLYDPATGGFYGSNSARDDTKGFWNGTGYVQYGPDIENTWGALAFIGSSGAAEMYGGDWVKAMPDWVKERAADWIYSLQDEDGFFYHPQWPKEYIQANNRQSRITRDRNSARTVLGLLGRTPKYTGYYVQNPLTGSFSGSSAVMVSKLVTTSAVLPQYASDEAFAEHLAKLELDLEGLSDERRAYKFYEYGNSFQSTTGDMTDNMKTMLEQFFDRHQNSENGMWSEKLYFNSTNGIHKIAAVYNSIGRELKHVDKIVESTIKILNFDPDETPAVHAVDMYNAWSCFPYIYTNIRKYSTGTVAEREARCLEIKAAVFENAVPMIKNSRENLEGFLYPDGSFGYSRTTVGSGGTNQGCPSAVPGAKEGDVNGNGIASTSLTACIFGALELAEYKIPIFTERERQIFVDILEELDQKYAESLK